MSREVKEIRQYLNNDRSELEETEKRFKILSWNIDGLDEQQNTIEIRTRGVIDVIKRYIRSFRDKETMKKYLENNPILCFFKKLFPSLSIFFVNISQIMKFIQVSQILSLSP